MIILGIETSCDETAAAVVTGDRRILSNLVLSQFEEHKVYGGVVPEIAARAHLENLDRLIAAAMEQAGIGFSDLAGVAATCGPGLVGGLLVGMMAGKAIAAAHDIPFLAINHLEGHALTPRLTDDIPFPYLVLLVSGGHTQILAAEGVGRYRRWGTTLDDAAGECFDKVAKLMGLPWPGGPHIEKLAQQCADPAAAQMRFDFPRPMKGRKDMDFSFSGLKTAARLAVESLPGGEIAVVDAAAIALSLQKAVADVLADRCVRALQQFVQNYPAAKPALVVCGGVSANSAIRSKLQGLRQQNDVVLHAPPLHLCTDNAAMIAWAGIERLNAGRVDGLDTKARPRWPLDPEAAPRHGAGVKA